MGLRKKLFLAILAMILLVVAASGAVLAGWLDGLLRQRLSEELFREAALAAELVLRLDPAAELATMDELADSMGRALGVRVTVIAEDGTVLGDSRIPTAEVGKMENHAGRPEVRAALDGGKGSNWRYSTTLGTDMHYVAVGVKTSGWRGVVRLARPAAEIDRRLGVVRKAFLATGGLAVVLAFLLSLVAASLVSRPLVSLVRTTRKMLSDSPPAEKGDELRIVSRSVRKLSEELGRHIQTIGRQRDLLQAVFEGLEEGLVVLDSESRLVRCNRAACSIFGRNDMEPGTPLVEITRAPEIHDLCRRSIAGAGTGSADVELSGGRFIHVVAVPLPEGLVLVARDVTRLRRTEKMRRDFVANVSHELRSPAAAIRAAAESLLAGALEEPGRARRFAESIERQASRLGRLVDDLLSLARIESGALQLDRQRVDVESLARRLAEQNASPANDGNMRIEIDIEKGLAVLADPAAVETILQNLLDNAIKYGEEGGTVTILARRTAGRIRIEVRDRGPGIEPRHRERVFERFYRVDKGRSRELGGTGLGLSIVKHLAEAMGGAVGLEPNSPRGSIFWVELDAAGKPETC